MLKCEVKPGCGRLVVAARDIDAGEVVFTEEAYAVAPNVDHAKKKFCVFCAAPVTTAFASCACCSSVFCCESCRDAHNEAHSNLGECAALQFCQLMRSKIPAEDLDTFQMACLIVARCVAEGKQQLLTREASSMGNADHLRAPTVQTVGLGCETADPLAFLNMDSPSLTCSSYEHVECLVTNLSDIDSEIIDDFSRLYDLYIEGVHKKKLMNKLKSMESFLYPDVSRITFLSLCCAFLCNGFGFWDCKGRKQATAVYPRSSYFNHNCAPNLGRRNVKHSRVIEFFTARKVEAGEQLCISYVDVRLPAAERIAKLRATYTFICQCQRCQPGADNLLANTTIGGAVPPLCDFCEAKIMQPLKDGTFVCPSCDKVQNPES